MLAPSAVHHLSHSSLAARSRVAMRFFPQTVYCSGSQCFLSVSALTGMLCPPRWACRRSCLPPCLPSGLGCCVRLAGLVFLLSAVLSPVSVRLPGLVFFLSLVLSPSLSPIWSGMLCSPSWLVSQPSLSPVFCPILFSSWSGVSVLWACLQNFMCDLCNCLGSTVV